jgi:hypothetical protein
MYFSTSAYSKTLVEMKTPTDPDNISEEIFQIYEQAIRKFALNFR